MIDAAAIVAAMEGRRNATLDLGGKGRLYVRRSHRFVEGRAVACLDLADIEVWEAHRRQGLAAAVIEAAQQAAAIMGMQAVYAESVINTAMQGALLRRGYVQVPGSFDLAPNFIIRVL